MVAAVNRRRTAALVAFLASAAPSAVLAQAPDTAPGWIGIRIEQRYECLWETQEDWKACNLRLGVTEMQEDGPAATSGLQLGDRLIAINGETIDSGNWERLVSSIRAGTPLSVDVMRDGDRHFVHVVPRPRPADAESLTWVRQPPRVAARARKPQVFVFTLTQPTSEEGVSFALTVRQTGEQDVQVEPVAVRVTDGQLRVTTLDDGVFTELPGLRGELLGNLEEMTESSYESATSALQVVDRVRARLSYPEFQRKLARIAQVGLEEATLAVRLRRSLGGAEFQPVRRFSGGRSGLLVVDVVPRTAAARVGLRSGDLVVRAGDVRTLEVQDLIAATTDEPVRIYWIREGGQMNSMWRDR